MEKATLRMRVGCKNGFFLYIKDTFAWVAQWIEQWFPKPLVAGSIPAPGILLKPVIIVNYGLSFLPLLPLSPRIVPFVP